MKINIFKIQSFFYFACLFFAVLTRADLVLGVNDNDAYDYNGAQFLSQSVPTTMTAGQAYQISITMKNTGTNTWIAAGGFKLGAQNPENNSVWGSHRVILTDAESVGVGQTKTFSFTVTAPATAGTYNFQWRMLKEYVEWFGDYTSNVVVTVNGTGGSTTTPAVPATSVVVNSTERDVMLSKIKYKGCLSAGLLSLGFPADIINRSGCEYIHRALDTEWGLLNFGAIKTNMAKITKSGMIYDLFITEGVNTSRIYYYPDENRNFDFAAMCKEGSGGTFGANTCIPAYSSAEYRKYLRYITRTAIDLGVGTVSFAQVYLGDNMAAPILPEIITEIKQYGAAKGKTILVGGQTNHISDKNYLNKMDFIIGGVGQNDKGELETGGCSTKFSDGVCWALLYNEPWRSYVDNVIIHFDWDGRSYVDADTFTKMPDDLRANFLRNTYAALKAKGVGFLMPYAMPIVTGTICGGAAAVLSSNGTTMYTPDKNGSCKDEEVINSIFGATGAVNTNVSNAQFVSQSISAKVELGKTYSASITMKNTGTNAWTEAAGFRLGLLSADVWGKNRALLLNNEMIAAGQSKTFTFDIKAPATLGNYNFQWQMLQEGGQWFGDKTTSAVISVATSVCTAKSVLGCKVCKADGSVWVDDNSKCMNGKICLQGTCVLSCIAKTCAGMGSYKCGYWNDGCGSTIYCGSCGLSQSCNNNGQCVNSSTAQTTAKKNGQQCNLNSDCVSGICSYNYCCSAGQCGWSGAGCVDNGVLKSNSLLDAVCRAGILKVAINGIGCNSFSCDSGECKENKCVAATGIITTTTTDTKDNTNNCVFDCLNKACGANGCGGSCGVCGSGFECSANGQCLVDVDSWGENNGGWVAISVKTGAVAEMSREEIIAKIAQIKQLIADLLKQLEVIKGRKYSCSQIADNLVYGMKNNPQVKCLQEVLIGQGKDIYPYISATGNYLDTTKQAVKKFQKKYAGEILGPQGLSEGTGIIDNLTRAKLNKIISASN